MAAVAVAADPKAVKASVKEGGKKGVDMCGMSDLGGVKFFTITLETPNGDMQLMDAVLEGMNAEVDESAEERKGGAGALGKMLLSAGDKQLAVVCHVPKALQESNSSFSLKEWVKVVVDATGAEVTEEGEELVRIVAAANADKGAFPLKMRDTAQNESVAYLRKKGLLPDDDSDSDDMPPNAEDFGVAW
ncbi:flagellar associated protein [Raphidocelis subcapitata]|uniref:Flagellar associated protein n=1 Tax=Raphidocelis subcapitata TaxID=307507 RepID=A0A2V0NMN1_9CHLO|nr:flagellar associated protein [Raphidocelis subcapitata]|eukprot:GBF88766.1 flagellar associated protein [Raphidocelis subcapitata]